MQSPCHGAGFLEPPGFPVFPGFQGLRGPSRETIKQCELQKTVAIWEFPRVAEASPLPPAMPRTGHGESPAQPTRRHGVRPTKAPPTTVRGGPAPGAAPPRSGLKARAPPRSGLKVREGSRPGSIPTRPGPGFRVGGRPACCPTGRRRDLQGPLWAPLGMIPPRPASPPRPETRCRAASRPPDSAARALPGPAQGTTP